MLYSYVGSVVSDLKAIKFFIESILEEIRKYISDEDLMFDLRLILNELVINGAYHGNNYEMSKRVRLEICLEEDNLRIQVQDEGDGIIEKVENYDDEELKCCGRGLLIVEKLSDEFWIDKNKFMVMKKIS